MDLEKINFFIDKFIKKTEGLDVYLTEYGKNSYLINLMIYPERLLERSPEYDFNYANKIRTIRPLEMEDLVINALKYTGQDTTINLTSFESHLSAHWGSYLHSYIDEVKRLLPDFINSSNGKYLKNLLSGLNIKYQVISIDLRHNKTTIIVYLKSITDKGPLYNFVNMRSFSDEAQDYLESNMNIDPQILVLID